MKFSLKKLAVICLSAVGMGAATFGVAGCVPKSVDMAEPENIEITRIAPPTDGSLPTAHTCAENLAYINYVFASQKQFHSYAYGVTAASIATQATRNWKDYKDGILINTDLTYSSMVKTGTQTCTVMNAEGAYDTYFRTSETPQSDTVPTTAVWSTEAPLYFDERGYHYTYGLLPGEPFIYIINEENITSSEAVVVNADGTYSQKFTLDPVASTYFYKYGMKTRGGLSGYPEFQSIEITVTFDGEWRILSNVMHEVSVVNKGVVVSSVTDFNTEYYYGEDHFDYGHYSAYDRYYKNYIGDETLESGSSIEEKPVMDVTNVLSNGFSTVMNGGQQFEITAALGKNKFEGYAFATLDLADPLGTLAVKASLGRTLGKQDLYVEFADGGLDVYYGDNFALNANLAEVKLAAGQFSTLIEKLKNAFSGGGAATYAATAYAEEESDPLTALMDSMVLEANDAQAVLTLKTDDLLGLGVGINARLVFGVNGNAITFRGGTVKDLSLNGEALDLSLTILTTTAPVISHDRAETPANLADYMADIYHLLDSDLLKVSVKLNGDGEQVKINELKGLNLDLTAYADIDKVAVGGDLKISYNYNGNVIFAELSVRYDYTPGSDNYGKAILSLTNLNGAPADVKLVCDISQLYDTITTLLMTGGSQGGVSLDAVVPVINGALSVNMINLLSDLYADGSKIKLNISIDTILKMFKVDAGVKFGTVALCYERGEGNHGGILSAALPALGLGLSVEGADGELPAPDYTGCLDVSYVIADVLDIIDSEYIEIGLNVDGDAKGVIISQLAGIDASLKAYVSLKGLTVAASAYVTYTYGGKQISANIVAGYNSNENSSGRLTVGLTAINGAPLYAYVTCDVDELITAVTALLDRAGISLDAFNGSGIDLSAQLAPVLNNILTADFSKLLPEIATDEQGLYLGLDIDEVLSLFGVNAGMEFGGVRLVYSVAENEKLLTATLPAFGIKVTAEGASGHDIVLPAPEKCLDLSDLVGTVNAAWAQVDEIIGRQAVNFTIGGDGSKSYLDLDGITVNISGEGEVSWKQGDKYVALDLRMSLTENQKTDFSTVRLYYSENAPADKPFVRLAIDGVGLDIYRSDIDNTVEGFNKIYEKIAKLLGLEGEEEEKAVALFAAKAFEGESDNATRPSGKDRLIGMLFGVLAKSDWVSELNKLTLTSDGRSVLLQIAGENASWVKIGAAGELLLAYDIKIGDRFTMSGDYTARAVRNGYSLVNTLNGRGGVFDNIRMASTKEGNAGFIKLVYDFLFEAIEGMSVDNILGDNTYVVEFFIDGSRTGEAKLQNTKIEAKILVTNETYEREKGKIAEGYLNIDVEGVVIELNVITERRGDTTRFYINLSRVMNVKLPDLKFMATQESLYDTIKVVIDTVTDTDILDKLGSLIGSGEAEEGGKKEEATAPSGGDSPNNNEEPAIEKSTIDKVADLLEKLLNFKFDDAVIAWEDRSDNTFGCELDIDNILYQLGLTAGKMGTVKIDIDHNTHSMSTSAVAVFEDTEGNINTLPWIVLSSKLDPVKADYSDEKFNRDSYISIEFLPTLISDLTKFATDDNGSLYNKFTLSGSLSATIKFSVLVSGTLNIDNLTVTVDMTDGLFVSAVMHVNTFRVTLAIVPITVINECTVGLTYENGYITLARGLDGTPEYKIMTFDYFLDHLFGSSGTSVLQWWLNVQAWDLLNGVFSSMGLNISSGLTSPEDIYLYKKSEAVNMEEISIYDYINALEVKFSDSVNPVTSLDKDNTISKVKQKFGLTDDYYAFALNSMLMTNGAINDLYAALTRSETGGLTGLMAYGNISDGIVQFSAKLAYNEGRDNNYLNGKLGNNVSVGSFYREAMAKIKAAGKTVPFDLGKDSEAGERFGCFSTADMSHDPSIVLKSYKLTIHNLDGTEEVRFVREGSNIYLYDNNSPVYTDDSNNFRLIYSTDPVNYLTGSVISGVKADKEVWAHSVAAVTVSIVNATAENKDDPNAPIIVINSFLGDNVPTSIDGLDTIEGPFYRETGLKVAAGDKITSTETVRLYGVFVQSVVYINDVEYTYSREKNGYAVTGKGAGFNSSYTNTETTTGKTLILESEINGYPVVSIAQKAFANTEGKSLRNIIVPESITEICENAFLDNVDMESAVFLAPKIIFRGTTGDKTMPFYGCNTSANNEKTNLVVYVNQVYLNIADLSKATTADKTYDWLHFITADVGLLHYRKYIGDKHSTGLYDANAGGAVYLAGEWSYVSFAVEIDAVSGSKLTAAIIENELKNYNNQIMIGSYENSSIKAEVSAVLDTKLAQYSVLDPVTKINYICVYEEEAQVSGSNTRVTIKVSYKATMVADVVSSVPVQLYGKQISSEITTMEIPVENGVPVLPDNLTDRYYIFSGWTIDTSGERALCTANWVAKKTYTFTVNISKGTTDTNIYYLNNVSQGRNVSNIKFTVYEGALTIRIESDGATITITDSSGTDYVIVAKEASILGKETGKLRKVTTSEPAVINVPDKTSISVKYSGT